MPKMDYPKQTKMKFISGYTLSGLSRCPAVPECDNYLIINKNLRDSVF